MPVYQLTDEIVFPPVELAESEGILAIGGDLSPERLIAAYSQGIFPWFSGQQPLLWWSPDPRFILIPQEIHISKSMKKVLNRGEFYVTLDSSFEKVIEACSDPRKYEKETWITEEMKQAYIRLHRMGFAHSVETWKNDQLVGGLYGVSLGRMFFGESMFSKVSNASKTALIRLSRLLEKHNFTLIDSQVYTEHMEKMGAKMISREEYIKLLVANVDHNTYVGDWGKIFTISEN